MSQSFQTTHPDLSDLEWRWGDFLWQWILVGGSPLKIHAEATRNIHGKWTWFGPSEKPPRKQKYGQCDTVTEAMSQAEAATADFLRGDA